MLIYVGSDAARGCEETRQTGCVTAAIARSSRWRATALRALMGQLSASSFLRRFKADWSAVPRATVARSQQSPSSRSRSAILDGSRWRRRGGQDHGRESIAGRFAGRQRPAKPAVQLSNYECARTRISATLGWTGHHAAAPSAGGGQRDSLRPAHGWAHVNRVGAARRDRRADGVSLGATFTSQAAGACARRARSPGRSPVAERPLLPRRYPPATDRPPPATASRRPQTASSTTPA